MRLLQYRAVPSALPHDILLSARVQQEYRMPGAWVMVVGA